MNNFKESILYQHAKRELELIGYDFSSDVDGIDNLMRDNILELLEVFYKQKHSESTSKYCISIFSKLANFEPLKPITGEDDEWFPVYSINNLKIYQNKRLFSLFKEGEDGKPYYLDAIKFRDQNGSIFTSSNVDGISSTQYVKEFPFLPRSFYIDVISYEVDKDDETKLKPGSGWWVDKIKDVKQLDPVWEYYERFDEVING